MQSELSSHINYIILRHNYKISIKERRYDITLKIIDILCFILYKKCMIKLSKYTVISNMEEGMLIYNTKNGAQLFFEKDYDDDDYKLFLEEKYDSMKNNLLLNLFCVDDDVDETSIVLSSYYKNFYDPTNISFIIMPNNCCNFSCIYCYQDHDKKVMTSETAQKFISAIKSYYYEHGIKNFYIEWFGGEPFMSYEMIKKVTNELNYFFKDKKVNYHYGATTNGSLLTKERLDFLIESKFDYFQITIDGGEKTHDRNRPFINGEPSWKKIFDNLKLLKTYEEDFNVVIRVNFNDETALTIDELLTKISNELDERFTIFFHSIGKWGGKNDSKLSVIDSSLEPYVMKLFMDEAIKYNVEPRTNYHYVDPFSRVCYAGMPYHFTLGTDGMLRKCNEEEQELDKFNIVGTINNEKIEIFIDKWSKFVLPGGHATLEKKCLECKYLPICFGQSCPKNRVLNNNITCPGDLSIIDDIILNKYKLYYSRESQNKGKVNK